MQRPLPSPSYALSGRESLGNIEKSKENQDLPLNQSETLGGVLEPPVSN